MALPLLQVSSNLSRRCNRAVRGASPTYKHSRYTCDPSLLLVHRLYKRKIQSDLIWYTSTATSQMHPDTARLSTYVDVKHARWLLLSSFVVAAKQHPCACMEENWSWWVKSTHVIDVSVHSMAHRGTSCCVEAEHWDAHHAYHACNLCSSMCDAWWPVAITHLTVSGSCWPTCLTREPTAADRSIAAARCPLNRCTFSSTVASITNLHECTVWT